MVEDRDGNFWFMDYTSGGIIRYDAQSRQTNTPAEGLADTTVDAITVDNKGYLWIATNYGVSRYDRKTWQTFTTEDGLSNNGMRSIAASIDGSLWFLTGSGISHYTS
jgi:ligand-binding sensor domain-containing protein